MGFGRLLCLWSTLAWCSQEYTEFGICTAFDSLNALFSPPFPLCCQPCALQSLELFF